MMNLPNRTTAQHVHSSDPSSYAVVRKLSVLDRFLPLWIATAIGIGFLLGWFFPHLKDIFDRIKLYTVSLPIAIGLLLMLYPVFAKVRYSKIRYVANDPRLLATSLILNWLVGPTLMWGLAWLTLPDLPEYRTGVVLVGLARCIAMVLIWNELADGDVEAAAMLVALNSLFQIITYSPLGYFYLEVLPEWLSLGTATINVEMWEVARSVLIFLGGPLAAGFMTRQVGEWFKGEQWYEQRFLPRIEPIALLGLLFTIVVIFALQGDKIIQHSLYVARISLPLLAYFTIIWTLAFVFCKIQDMNYARSVSVAFTAASNNFELAIAVSTSVFGITSGQTLAGVVGALIEVPVLVGLVYVSLWIRRRFYSTQIQRSHAICTEINSSVQETPSRSTTL